ncbi:hypothetical protein [Methanocella sp. MCL-LM]|uniref:hypothetical protein n=1 Tax=Methanocella sp. MCL-LM TaxID=3412035 RepID=UPI003C7619EE
MSNNAELDSLINILKIMVDYDELPDTDKSWIDSQLKQLRETEINDRKLKELWVEAERLGCNDETSLELCERGIQEAYQGREIIEMILRYYGKT